MYAIIDDYSRKILGAEELRDCTAKSCKKILKKTIEDFGTPFCVWSDNGSETKAEFHKFLIKHGINHVTTRPHCPQQNGKIERFWTTFEGLYKVNNFERSIEIYNNSPHSSLQKISKQINGKTITRFLTPNEAYKNPETKWNDKIEPLWKVDGVQKKFLPEKWNDEDDEEESE